MQEHLMKLLEAQENDLEIDKLIKSKKEYPVQIEGLTKDITDLKNEIEKIEERLLEAQKTKSVLETEILSEKDNLSKKEKRLLETKTNKEYLAVQHEIEQSKERIDSLETEEIQMITEIDTLVPKKAELSEKYETLRNENENKISEINEKLSSIESDISVLDKKRDEILSNVETKVLTVYNRLRKGRKGIAIATIDQHKLSCTGCYKQLPPQKVLEVRRANRVYFCESCGRILAWDSRDISK